MSLEVTINVPGLKELSEALMQLAVAMGGKSVQINNKKGGGGCRTSRARTAEYGRSSLGECIHSTAEHNGGRTNSFSTSTSISTVSAGTRSSTDI